MNGVRVIGIGSPFANDQLGWQVIDVLEQDRIRNKFPGKIGLCRSDRPGAGLLSLFENIDCALLIDAIDNAVIPDTVQRLEKDDLLLNTTTLSSHAFGVAETLSLGDKLGLLPDQITLYGYGTDNNQSFTPQQIRQLADAVIEDLNTRGYSLN